MNAWAAPGLQVGDRLPDLRAPLADGSVFVLSEDAGGLPVVFVVAAVPPDVNVGALVVHVARAGAPPDLSRLSLHDDGRIADVLTGGVDGAVVAGADHRVVAVGGVDELERLCRLLPADSTGRLRSTTTPLLVVAGVLETSLCNALVSHAESVGFERSPMLRETGAGAVEPVVDPAKARFDVVLADGELADALDQRLLRRLLPEVRRSLGHRIQQHEAYKLVRYEAGSGWFEAHRDNTAPHTAHRVLAVTINLDDGYTGGDLRFPELGPDHWRPDPGAAIVFSCSLLHDVTPVTAGTRNAAITFLS